MKLHAIHHWKALSIGKDISVGKGRSSTLRGHPQRISDICVGRFLEIGYCFAKTGITLRENRMHVRR